MRCEWSTAANVIVGALCISQTLVPRRSDGTQDPDALSIESLLTFNVSQSDYAQSLGGDGSG
jgi:hypothetical protein